MSVDHVVIGITRCDSGVFINCLQRDNPHLNETRFKLTNTPPDLMKLLPLLTCDIWGNSSDVLIGNTHVATREGYSVFRLDSWDHVENAIKEWKGNHAS